VVSQVQFFMMDQGYAQSA